MAFYWSIFISILLFSLVEQFNYISTARIKIAFYFVVFCLFCLSFMRWERGSDWNAYYNLFLFGTNEDKYEYGYLYFNKLIRAITDNYTIYLFFQSGLYYSLFVTVADKINKLFNARKYSRCYFPLLLYSLSNGYAGLFNVRSSIAYMMCILALTFLCEKKYLKYMFWVVIATLFHKSALFFLFVYPIFRYEINKEVVAVLILFTLFLSTFSSQIVSFLNFISLENYTQYIEEGRGSLLGILKWVAAFIALALLIPLKSRNLGNKVLLVFAIGVILFIWCQIFSTVAQRVAGLYLNACLLLIALIILHIEKVKKLLFILGLGIFVALSLWSSLNSQYQDLIIPYKFFWDNFYVVTY